MSTNKFAVLGGALLLAASLAGCTKRLQPTPQPPQTVVEQHSYVDLQPGGRVRVVTPVLKSGGFKLRSTEVSGGAGGLVIKTDDDFVGYEVAYYTIQRRRDGVAVKFASADITRNFQTSAQTQPILPLFTLPDNVRHVRVLFLTRVSEADHDQAILGAATRDELDSLTQAVESDPNRCDQPEHGFCRWVPAGVAVQPEAPQGYKR